MTCVCNEHEEQLQTMLGIQLNHILSQPNAPSIVCDQIMRIKKIFLSHKKDILSIRRLNFILLGISANYYLVNFFFF